MHLGLMMECEYRAGASDQQSFDEAFSLADAAEEQGWDGIWLAERHFASAERVKAGGAGAVPSFASAPLILASALAARTQRVRIGIAVSVLPLAHPIRLAEEVATIDHISHGRLDLGVGRSAFPSSYKGYAVAYEESRTRFSECLDVMTAAWTQDSFSYAGEFYAFEDVSLVPRPYQHPHPPVRVAATTADTFPQVGRMGYPIFVGLRSVDVPDVARNLQAYHDAWREAGHPGRGDVYLRLPVYVAETSEQAYEEPRESTEVSYGRVAENYARSAGVDGGAADASRAQRAKQKSYDELLRDRLAYGTPEAVTERLRSLKRDLGLSGIVIEPNVGGIIPRERVFNSVRLFATEVAPALRN